MIGLFSGLDPTIGGIEASGAEAWVTMRTYLKSARAIIFDPKGCNSRKQEGVEVFAQSKLDLLAAVIRRSWNSDVLLCWHLGLLKIIPFMRQFRGRLVLFVHGVEAWRSQGALTRRLLGRVDHFLSNTQYTWDRFLTYQPQLANASHTVVPLGIGTPFVGAIPAPSSIPAALILGRMARNEDYKGHRELIRLWPLVQERVPGAELWIAGEGDLRPVLETLAKRTTGNAVRFLGRVTESQKQDLLARSRCLAMPSRGEGFGLVYLEAMRVGRPCLVSNQDAGREVIAPPQAGLAADPADPADLTNALADLLNPGPRWNNWSRAARTRYETEFTADHFGRRLLAALSRPAFGA